MSTTAGEARAASTIDIDIGDQHKLGGTSEVTVDASRPDVQFRALLEESIRAIEEGDEDKARSLLVQLTDKYPTVADAWHWRARVAIDFPELIECLNRAADAAPDDEDIQADLKSALARYDAAEKALQRAKLAASKSETSERGLLAGLWSRFQGLGFRASGACCVLLAVLWLLAGLAPLLAWLLSGASLSATGLWLEDIRRHVPFQVPSIDQIVAALPVSSQGAALFGTASVAIAVLFAAASDMLAIRRGTAALWLLAALGLQFACLRITPSPVFEMACWMLSAGAVAGLLVGAWAFGLSNTD